MMSVIIIQLNSQTYKNDPDVKDEHELYTVQPKDTIETVAEKFDLDVDTLVNNYGLEMKKLSKNL